MDENVLATTFLSFSVQRMLLTGREITTCIDRLTEAQMLQRGAEHENSIANLLMHLEGNLRQWFLHGIDGQPDVRQRDAEFDLEPAFSVSEIRTRFAATLAECCSMIGALPPERLLEKIDPQPGGNWGPMTILEAIFRIVGHLQLHTGQIMLLTKQMSGRDLDLSIPRKR